MVTAPLAALTVTGNDAAAADAPDGAAADGAAAAELADVAELVDEPQPASTAAVTAAMTATAARGVEIRTRGATSSREGGKEGETAGPARERDARGGRDGRPSHEGRYRPARQESTWL